MHLKAYINSMHHSPRTKLLLVLKPTHSRDKRREITKHMHKRNNLSQQVLSQVFEIETILREYINQRAIFCLTAAVSN